MIKEIDIMGVFVSPMVGFVIATFILHALVRMLLRRAGVYRWVWHPPLFNTALFVIILALLVAIEFELR